MQSRKLHVPDKIAYGVVRGHRTERITPTGVWRRENKNSFLEEEVCEVGLQGCPVRDHAKTERKKKRIFWKRKQGQRKRGHREAPGLSPEHHGAPRAADCRAHAAERCLGQGAGAGLWRPRTQTKEFRSDSVGNGGRGMLRNFF